MCALLFLFYFYFNRLLIQAILTYVMLCGKVKGNYQDPSMMSVGCHGWMQERKATAYKKSHIP